MQRPRLLAGVSASAVVLVGLAANQAAAREAKTAVGVTEKEFTIAAKPSTAKAGPVVFTVKNTGKLEHELVVVKTKLAPSKLPVKGTKASEAGRVGKIPPFEPGTTKRLAVNLKAGKYVLFCNVAGHYKLGQRTGFTVR